MRDLFYSVKMLAWSERLWAPVDVYVEKWDEFAALSQ
jgi:hypothetical protein